MSFPSIPWRLPPLESRFAHWSRVVGRFDSEAVMNESHAEVQGPPAVEAVPERRAWVRYGTDLDVACRTAAARKEFGWMAKVRNISGGGIGLVLRHRFRPGTWLFIELRSRAGEFCRTVTVKVIHASAVKDGSTHAWLMGCAFAVPLSEEEVRALC